MRLGTLFFKRTIATKAIKTKVCIVGSGPAGFYAAQLLAKKVQSEIDIYEKLPVPFGLIRYGVAPDHQDVKNVVNTFTKTAELPNVRFIGNVALGKDVTLQQLKQAYHVVLLAYGAEENKKLNIPGENLHNVVAAKNVVGWYNGTPWDKNLNIDLSGETAAIFGQGNVAIDVARILLTPVDALKKTDITQHALEALSRSKVKNVLLIGRRGPLQTAFTIKEFRDMLKLKNCNTILNKSDFENVEESIANLQRPRKRLIQLLVDTLKTNNSTQSCDKCFKPIFYRSPIEIVENGSSQIKTVYLGVNELQENKAVLTELRETLNCELAVSSVGYKSLQPDKDIPFDVERGIVKNINGKIDKGLYGCGWLTTGPVGVIVTTMNNAFATASDVLKDVELEGLANESKSGFEAISKLLKEKNVQTVFWENWLKIDAFEKREGEKLGKPREKIVDVEKMLEIGA